MGLRISIIAIVLIATASDLFAYNEVDSLRKHIHQLKTKSANSKQIIDAYNNLAQLLITRDPKLSIRIADTAIYLSLESQYRQGEAAAYIISANSYEQFQNTDSAIALSNRALSLAKTTSNKQAIVAANTVLGNCYYSKSDMERAMNYFLTSLSLSETDPSLDFNTASTQQNLLNVFMWKKDYTRALQYAKASLSIYNRYKNYSYIGNSLNTIGNVFYTMGKLDSARIYFEKSAKIALQQKEYVRYYAALNNVAAIYADSKKYESAIEILNENLKYANLPELRSSLYYNMGTCYLGLKKFNLAHAMLDSTHSIANLHNILEDRLLVFELRSEVYAGEKKFDKSLEYYKKYIALKDSAISTETVGRINELNIKYETVKKERKISELDQARIYESKIKTILVYSISILVLLLIIAIYYYFNKRALARKLQITNTDLFDANKEINKQKQELELINERLEQLNQDKNEFLGIAAHDLKNPLSNISMIADTIKLYSEQLSKDKLMKMIENIKITSKRMTDIIVNLLDVNAIDSGNIHFDIKEISSNNIVKEIYDTYYDKAVKKNIKLNLELMNEDVMITFDERTAREILDNLLSNAIKFSPSNTEITLRAKRLAGEGLFLSIIDQGPGLSEEDKVKLFTKYTKLSARPTAGENSTGLGLSIVKKLADLLDARVYCESEQGKGAEFILHIPEDKILTFPEIEEKNNG